MDKIDELFMMAETQTFLNTIHSSSPADLDKMRAKCAENSMDYELNADVRITWQRLAALLRKEMGPL